MIYSIYAVRDLRTGYLNPILDLNDSSAARSFRNMLKRPDTPMGTNPEDFELYYLGVYDSDTAELIPEDKKIVITGSDYQRSDGGI